MFSHHYRSHTWTYPRHLPGGGTKREIIPDILKLLDILLVHPLTKPVKTEGGVQVLERYNMRAPQHNGKYPPSLAVRQILHNSAIAQPEKVSLTSKTTNKNTQYTLVGTR